MNDHGCVPIKIVFTKIMGLDSSSALWFAGPWPRGMHTEKRHKADLEESGSTAKYPRAPTGTWRPCDLLLLVPLCSSWGS